MYKLPFQSPKLFSLSSLIPCCTSSVAVVYIWSTETSGPHHQYQLIWCQNSACWANSNLQSEWHTQAHTYTIHYCQSPCDTPELTSTLFISVSVPEIHPSSHTHTIHYHQCPYVFLQFLCLPLHVGWQCWHYLRRTQNWKQC